MFVMTDDIFGLEVQWSIEKSTLETYGQEIAPFHPIGM